MNGWIMPLLPTHADLFSRRDRYALCNTAIGNCKYENGYVTACSRAWPYEHETVEERACHSYHLMMQGLSINRNTVLPGPCLERLDKHSARYRKAQQTMWETCHVGLYSEKILSARKFSSATTMKALSRRILTKQGECKWDSRQRRPGRQKKLGRWCIRTA